MPSIRSRARKRTLLAAVTFAAVLGAGCGGGSGGPVAAPLENGIPGAQDAPAPGPNMTASAAPVSTSAASPPATASPAAPTGTPAAPTATPPAAPTTPERTPRVTPKPATAEGSLRLALTAPIEADVTVPADVRCDIGRTYHMFTHAELDDEGVEVTVDIPIYQGPDDYRALLRVMVGTPEGTQGGEIPAVPVTIESDAEGRAEFSYTGANGSVEGMVVWSCSP